VSDRGVQDTMTSPVFGPAQSGRATGPARANRITTALRCTRWMLILMASRDPSEDSSVEPWIAASARFGRDISLLAHGEPRESAGPRLKW
jgi:hypothetical protein